MNEEVLFRPQAREDLTAHTLWIARESERRAHTFLDRIESTLQQLRIFPELGTSRDWLAPRCRGIRFIPVKDFPRYYIFYRPMDESIEVIRILHAARDTGTLLVGES